MRTTPGSIGFGVLFTCWALAASAQSLVLTNSDYPSIAGARGIAVADFNRDGWPDVAEAAVDSRSVAILLSTPHTGALALKYTVAVGAGPFDITTADFNRDGIPDLAVANADGNSVSVLVGQGDGRFTRADIDTQAGPRGIAAGDINGDGRPDLVYTAYSANVVVILLGNGAGGFSPASVLGTASQPQGVAVADLNGDGRNDVVVASFTGLLAWYGGITGRQSIAGDSSLNVLAVGDLNADGRPDVAVASTDRGRVAIYRGTPSGLVYSASYSVDADPRGITIADLNGDGRADVVTAHRTTSTVDVLPADAAHPGAFLPHLVFASGHGSRAVATADFNADGRVDVVTGNQYVAAASVLFNGTALQRAGYTFGLATFSPAVALASRTYASEARGLLTADFNRDGRPDFVQRVAGSASVAVVLNGGGTTVVLAGADPFSGDAVGDFNGDGRMDVVVTGGAEIRTYLGNGTGNFGAAITTSASVGGCVAGDMNRDGRLDLVCEGQVMLGSGSGAFTAGVTFTTPSGDPVRQVRLADLNRDGALDVVAQGALWYGAGNGQLSAAADMSWGGTIQVSDVNHDGYPDVVFTDSGTSVAVSLGGATGFASPVWVYGQGLEAGTDIIITDVDADGNPDIVINFLRFDADTAGVVNVIPGNGDGTFRAGEPFALAAGELVATDATADGLADIVVAHDRVIDILVNQRNETNHAPVVTAADVTLSYQACITLPVTASDPDQHALVVSWQGGDVNPVGLMGTLATAVACIDAPGVYHYQVTVADGRGAIVTRSFTVTVTGAKEIYLHMNQGAALGTGWEIVNDASAADGIRAHNANRGAPKVQAPLANPPGYVELVFQADPALTYKLWLRLEADGNDWANDSVWVQFSGSTDAAGSPAYRIGTASGLAVNLEECLNCGISGWGWQDDGWGGVNVNGVTMRFPAGGEQRIRIQTREDGASVDQVVLSAQRYLTTPPGTAKNDATILPATQ